MQELYINAKGKLLNDKKICEENKALFKKVLEFKEVKLKRQNKLIALDNSSYKTLVGYIYKFKQVNKMFKNKPLKELTKEDIKKVLDDFVDGKILRKDGKPHTDNSTYFNQIFTSTLFDFAGKKEIVKEIMKQEFYNTSCKNEVRFILDEDIDKIVNTAIRIDHKAFLQLYRDIGENPFSILQLEKRDCRRSVNDDGEPEYHINLRKEILKRSRTPRTEITNFRLTTELLDEILKDKKDNDKLFSFQLRQAEMIFSRAIKILNIKVIPTGEKARLKDIRSSMACNLLKIGWTTDEVNARLGHSVGSKELRKYVTFLAMDRHKVKKKVYEGNLAKLESEIEESKQRERLKDTRLERQEIMIEQLVKDISDMKKIIKLIPK